MPGLFSDHGKGLAEKRPGGWDREAIEKNGWLKKVIDKLFGFSIFSVFSLSITVLSVSKRGGFPIREEGRRVFDL